LSVWSPPRRLRHPVGVIETDVVQLVQRLPGVEVVRAGRDNGAPEIAWGDSFFFYDPDDVGESARRQPFATIVTKNYGEFDAASDLDRPGVFRVNVAVGRRAFEQLFGHPAPEHAEHSGDYDYAELDRLLPHPVYATQGWVCVLNPGTRTASQLESLLADAHGLAAERYRRRGFES
jgi:hypothetical protein